MLDFLALQTAVYPPPEEGQVFGHVVYVARKDTNIADWTMDCGVQFE